MVESVSPLATLCIWAGPDDFELEEAEEPLLEATFVSGLTDETRTLRRFPEGTLLASFILFHAISCFTLTPYLRAMVERVSPFRTLCTALFVTVLDDFDLEPDETPA